MEERHCMYVVSVEQMRCRRSGGQIWLNLEPLPRANRQASSDDGTTMIIDQADSFLVVSHIVWFLLPANPSRHWQGRDQTRSTIMFAGCARLHRGEHVSLTWFDGLRAHCGYR